MLGILVLWARTSQTAISPEIVLFYGIGFACLNIADFVAGFCFSGIVVLGSFSVVLASKPDIRQLETGMLAVLLKLILKTTGESSGTSTSLPKLTSWMY